MSKSFKECVEFALAVELLLVVMGETLPGLEHLLPLGGSHLKQVGALLGAAIAIYAIRHFFGTSRAAPNTHTKGRSAVQSDANGHSAGYEGAQSSRLVPGDAAPPACREVLQPAEGDPAAAKNAAG